MGDQDFPKSAVRKVEKHETFPLVALVGITDLRSYLNAVEAEAIVRARDLGATAEDIADALGITRQGVYYKLRALNSEGSEIDEQSESRTDTGAPDGHGDRPSRFRGGARS